MTKQGRFAAWSRRVALRTEHCGRQDPQKLKQVPQDNFGSEEIADNNYG